MVDENYTAKGYPLVKLIYTCFFAGLALFLGIRLHKVKKLCIVADFVGLVAQLVEQRIENPRVGGSIPPQATKFSRPLIQNIQSNQRFAKDLQNQRGKVAKAAI